ncbi:MAG TPA: serine/threonine-protein kinase [Pirellulaceae bacterium]|nr:serine/threonine-protein kinase [Pirellulaceae bacterium]
MATRSTFRHYALMSGLVTQEQLQHAISALTSAPDGPQATLMAVDDAELANKLVEMGVLTTYQAEQILGGRSKFKLGLYIVTESIGKGGMGQVFKAVHEMMGRVCAVKVLPLEKSTPEAINHFIREVRTHAQLDHPNLVRAYDAGRDKDVPYLVTEYVPGSDLRKLIRSRGRLSQQQAASVIMQAARGLEYAHQRGLIHRDIKPGNILVTPDGIAKVSDLGLAGFIHGLEDDPRAGKIVGTADYLAPEQINNPNEITHVSDIYSLGCTLYYAVSGKVPFPGGTARDKARRHREETPWHPRRFNPELNEEFVDIIADMMEKEPVKRIQSASEVVARLEQWASEVAPIAGSVQSPWKSGPLPTAEEESRGIGQDTEASEYPSGANQLSQGTSPIASAGHETLPVRSRSPAEFSMGSAVNWSHVMLTLIVAVPISMLAGAILATALSWLMR